MIGFVRESWSIIAEIQHLSVGSKRDLVAAAIVKRLPLGERLVPRTKKILDSTIELVYHCTSTQLKEVVMQLSIEPNNGIPIYEQLVRQVKYAVAEGVVMPGQLVPSVRELAKSLAINPNTVQRAYLELQSEEVIESLRGRGMAVCAGAKRRCVSDRQMLLGERLSAVVDEAIRSGLEPDRLREMFDKAIKAALRSEGVSE